MKKLNKFSEWVHEIPKEEGRFWFYGILFAHKMETEDVYELLFCEIVKVANGWVIISEGRFLYKEEFGKEWYFKRCDLPELPKLKRSQI